MFPEAWNDSMGCFLAYDEKAETKTGMTAVKG